MLQRFTRLAFVPTVPALSSFPIQELAPAHFAWASAEVCICTPTIANVLQQVRLPEPLASVQVHSPASRVRILRPPQPRGHGFSGAEEFQSQGVDVVNTERRGSPPTSRRQGRITQLLLLPSVLRPQTNRRP